MLPCCQSWRWEKGVGETTTRCNGVRVISHGRCAHLHVAHLLLISPSVRSFISGSYSLCSVSFFTLHPSPPVVFLRVILCLSPTFFLATSLSQAQRRRWLFLAGWVWNCVMINMLPRLLILSNGSVKLQRLDKYRRWRSICGAAQRHNEGKQLELIGYDSVKAAVEFRRGSKASSMLHLTVCTPKSQTPN